MKVLIVDDEAHVIRAVKLLVPWQELGITETYEALTPQDAIRIIEAEQPEILITDIVMQDLSGIDLMKYIAGSLKHIKVIVISGYNNFDYVRSSLQHGGVDYLLKPLDQDQLIEAVKKAAGAWNQEHDLYHTAQIHKDQIDSMATLCRENLLSRLIHGDRLRIYLLQSGTIYIRGRSFLERVLSPLQRRARLLSGRFWCGLSAACGQPL